MSYTYVEAPQLPRPLSYHPHNVTCAACTLDGDSWLHSDQKEEEDAVRLTMYQMLRMKHLFQKVAPRRTQYSPPPG